MTGKQGPREVRPHLSGVGSLIGSPPFVGEARAYLWTSSVYECLTDLLLVFAESAMSLFVVASNWLHSAIFIL